MILIYGSKSGLGDNFGQYGTKTIILCLFFGQTPFRNSVVMATPKVPGDKKLPERVLYAKTKRDKSFSFLHLMVSELYQKTQLGGGKFALLPPPHPVQNRVNLDFETKIVEIC